MVRITDKTNEFKNVIKTQEDRSDTQGLDSKALVNIWLVAKGFTPGNRLLENRVTRFFLSPVARAFVKAYNKEQAQSISGVAGKILTKKQQSGRAIVHDAFLEKAKNKTELITAIVTVREWSVPSDILDDAWPVTKDRLARALNSLKDEHWQDDFETKSFNNKYTDAEVDLLVALSKAKGPEERRALLVGAEWQDRANEWLGAPNFAHRTPGNSADFSHQMLALTAAEFAHVPETFREEIEWPEGPESAELLNGLTILAHWLTEQAKDGLRELPRHMIGLQQDVNAFLLRPDLLDALNDMVPAAAKASTPAVSSPPPSSASTLASVIGGVIAPQAFQGLSPSDRAKVDERLYGIAEKLRAVSWTNESIILGISNLVRAVGLQDIARMRPFTSESSIHEEYAALIQLGGQGEIPPQAVKFTLRWIPAALEAGLRSALIQDTYSLVMRIGGASLLGEEITRKRLIDALKLLSKDCELSDQAVLHGLELLLTTSPSDPFAAADDLALAARIVSPLRMLQAGSKNESYRRSWEEGLRPTFRDNPQRAALRNAFLDEIGYAGPYQARSLGIGWEPSKPLRELFATIEDFSIKHQQYSPLAVVRAFRERVLETQKLNDTPEAQLTEVISAVAKDLPQLYEEVLRQELVAVLGHDRAALVEPLRRTLTSGSVGKPLTSVQVNFVRLVAARMSVSEISTSQARSRLAEVSRKGRMQADQVTSEKDAQDRLKDVEAVLAKESSAVSLADVVNELKTKPMNVFGRAFDALCVFFDSPASFKHFDDLKSLVGESRGAQAMIIRLLSGVIAEDERVAALAVQVKRGKPIVRVQLEVPAHDIEQELLQIADRRKVLLADAAAQEALPQNQRTAHQLLTALSNKDKSTLGISPVLYDIATDPEVRKLFGGGIGGRVRLAAVKAILTPGGISGISSFIRLFRGIITRFVQKQIRAEMGRLHERRAALRDEKEVAQLGERIALLEVLNSDKAIGLITNILIEFAPKIVANHPRVADYIDLLGKIGDYAEGKLSKEQFEQAGATTLAGLMRELPQYGALVNHLQAALTDI